MHCFPLGSYHKEIIYVGKSHVADVDMAFSLVMVRKWQMYMLGSIFKLAPFLNGAAPSSSLKMELLHFQAPFAAPFSSNI